MLFEQEGSNLKLFMTEDYKQWDYTFSYKLALKKNKLIHVKNAFYVEKNKSFVLLDGKKAYKLGLNSKYVVKIGKLKYKELFYEH